MGGADRPDGCPLLKRGMRFAERRGTSLLLDVRNDVVEMRLDKRLHAIGLNGLHGGISSVTSLFCERRPNSLLPGAWLPAIEWVVDAPA